MRDHQAVSAAGHQSPVPLAMELPFDLSWYSDSAQGPNPIAMGEHTSTLSWNSETNAFLNGTPNKPWQCHPSEEYLFPPSGDYSRPSSASSCLSASVFPQNSGFLEQTEQGFYGAPPIDDAFPGVGIPQRNCQACGNRPSII